MELIRAVLRKRKDFYFYLLVPEELMSTYAEEFNTKKVILIPLKLVPRQQGGAFHFDVREITSVFDFRRMDIDVLFLNQPELTAPFLDLFNKIHFFDIHSFGYIHWMDWKRADNVKNRWNQPANLNILTSVLLSAVTGCNSNYGKQRILREAGTWFNAATLERIDSKLVPLWPGIESAEILAAKTTERFRKKTIIFPFRTQKYTGFKSLIEIHLANLWKKRQDFRILLTNPSDYDYVKNYPKRFPFVEVCHFNRRDYLKTLWKADIVVGCHNGSNQWSLAAVEAIAAECVPLLNQTSFFPEMLLAATPKSEWQAVKDKYLYYRSTFCERMEALLDSLKEEKRYSKKLARRFRQFYAWENRVDDWIRCFELADAMAPEITNRSKAIGDIEALLKANGKCSKQAILEHMKWHPKSRQISWTKYRKHLRRIGTETAESPVVIFQRKGN